MVDYHFSKFVISCLDNVPLCCQCLLIEVNLVFVQTVAMSRDELVGKGKLLW